MPLGSFGKRVFDTALQWRRRLPAPPLVDPTPVRLREEAARLDREAEEDRRRTAHAMRTARNERAAEAIAAFVAAVRHLPLFSGTATQLVRSAGDENVGARELVRLISTDAGLVAHLLRIVNSPFFGFPRRLATVGDALSVLGIDHVRRTVTAAVMQRPLMAYLNDSAVVRIFWRHELLCAALARHIAIRRGVDGELAYMAGLMHDVGRLAMLMQFPGRTDVLLHVRSDDDRAAFDREFETFGFDHAQAGGALLERWGLPAEIARAAREHGDEVEPDDPIAASVWHANRLTHAMENVPDELDSVQQPWMIAIGLSVNGRRRILDEIDAFEGDAG